MRTGTAASKTTELLRRKAKAFEASNPQGGAVNGRKKTTKRQLVLVLPADLDWILRIWLKARSLGDSDDEAAPA